MARLLPLALLILYVSSVLAGPVKRGSEASGANQAQNDVKSFVDEQGRKEYVIGGDEVVDEDEKNSLNAGNGRTKRASFFNVTAKIWPKNADGIVKIPYTRAGFSVDATAWMDATISFIKKNTCIDIVPRNNEADYVHISSNCAAPLQQGCWSHLGKIGNMQRICLPNGCRWAGLMAHEIGHTVGLNHEHQRADRDQHVAINTDNVQAGAISSFDLNAANLSDTATYREGSIMHYEQTSFSKNGGVTIAAIGNTNGTKFLDGVWLRFFDYTDIEWLNIKYECSPCKWTKMANHQYFGGTEVPGVTTVYACKRACWDAAACTAIDFNKVSNKCYAIDNVSGKSEAANNDVDTHIMGACNRCTWNQIQNNQYFGGTEFPGANTLEKCKTACAAGATPCAAFDWNKATNKCYTLDTLAGKTNVANNDVDTYTKTSCDNLPPTPAEYIDRVCINTAGDATCATKVANNECVSNSGKMAAECRKACNRCPWT